MELERQTAASEPQHNGRASTETLCAGRLAALYAQDESEQREQAEALSRAAEEHLFSIAGCDPGSATS